VKSFDGRRSGSTRAVRPSRGGRRRRSRRVERRLFARQKRGGAHRATSDGASDGSASRSRVGKTTPACRAGGAHARRSESHRSPRPGSAWGAVKRAMHLHARSAKARRAWAVAERRSSSAGRGSIEIDSSTLDRSWVLVSTVSVADAGRTHLRPCGPNCESGLDDVEMLKCGVEPARDHRNERGLVARRRSSVFDAHERISEGSRRKGAQGLDFVVSQLRSRLTVLRPARGMRAIRRKASRRDVVGSNPVYDSLVWCPRLLGWRRKRHLDSARRGHTRRCP